MRRIGRHRRKKQKKILIIGSLSLLLFLCVGYAAFSTNISLKAKGNIKDKSRVIQAWSSTDQTDFHSDYYKENIVSATFLDNADVPSNATESWNVSEDKTHGGVMAWVIPNDEDNTKYDLYVGAKNGVVANEDSGFLFDHFIKVETIEFNDNFDTSNVTNMNQMFYHCNNLNNLDLSNFNTENVTNMHSVFDGCSELVTLDLSNFNTANVTSMNAMFYGCRKLTSVNISNFNTDKVIDMGWMFYLCDSLINLNLCNFNTSSAKIMKQMFYQTSNLKQIYVGPNWTTANADTTNMFQGSGVSEVTIGQC